MDKKIDFCGDCDGGIKHDGDATEHLLAGEANRKHLLASRNDLRFVKFSVDELIVFSKGLIDE